MCVCISWTWALVGAVHTTHLGRAASAFSAYCIPGTRVRWIPGLYDTNKRIHTGSKVSCWSTSVELVQFLTSFELAALLLLLLCCKRRSATRRPEDRGYLCMHACMRCRGYESWCHAIAAAALVDDASTAVVTWVELAPSAHRRWGEGGRNFVPF